MIDEKSLFVGVTLNLSSAKPNKKKRIAPIKIVQFLKGRVFNSEKKIKLKIDNINIKKKPPDITIGSV